jgi:hypothetical protein
MDGRVKSEVEERRAISKLSRDELEDKYIRLYEEHLALKKKEKGQEDKMKRMATKLLRLAADKKEEEKHSHSGPTCSYTTIHILTDSKHKFLFQLANLMLRQRR